MLYQLKRIFTENCQVILDLSTRNQGNQQTEIYGACHHIPNFHRYCVPAAVSTDDEVSTLEIIDTNHDSPISTNKLLDICTDMNNLTILQAASA